MNKLYKGIRIVILTVMTIIGILLIIGYFDLALCKRNYNANIKERLETTWEVKLPEEMKELYNCYQLTFTGRACQYVVLSCNDNDKKQFNSMFAFKPKDEESVKSLQSIFDHMNNEHEKKKINEDYLLNLSEDYEYYVIENSVWLVICSTSQELIVCIRGY